jgi:hypothetical protein
MTYTEQSLEKKCKAATNFSDAWQLPVDRYGHPIRQGYKLCKRLDCIEATHSTQSRYVAKRIYGKTPNLYRKNRVVPASIEQLESIAKPTDRTQIQEGCQVSECNQKHRALGLCNAHHNKLYRHRAKDSVPERIKNDWSDIDQYVLPAKGNALTAKERFCHYPQCERDYFARGLCKIHHKRWLRFTKGKNV